VTFDHAQIDNNIKIAPLIFLILLENAFKHGVERITEGAYIKLKLVATDNEISFIIENNYDASEAQTPGGIGLNNLRKRLQLLFPDKHDLKISSDVAEVFNVRLDIKFK
jgi:LytS/YehU family sensor histidine kinase